MKEGRTTLNLYLLKVARGDMSCLDRLSRRLADRVLCIPILADGGSQSGGMRLNVFCYAHFDKEITPVFTSEAIFNNWRTGIEEKIELVQLLGADFCAALGNQTWLSVDEGSEHAAVLEPEVVLKIAAEPYQDGEDFIGTVPPVITESAAAVQEIAHHLNPDQFPQLEIPKPPPFEDVSEASAPDESALEAERIVQQIISGVELPPEETAQQLGEQDLSNEPQPIYLGEQHIIRAEVPAVREGKPEAEEPAQRSKIQDWD